eukprot:3642788-Amphidinium_carterae.1
MKEHCDALETQLRSIARALTMNGTLNRSDIEWQIRHDLFDQLMDDCAGEMAECCDGDLNLEGSGTALPGGSGKGIPHLSLLDVLRVDETRGGDQPDGSGTALPGVPEGKVTIPRMSKPITSVCVSLPLRRPL